MRTSFLLGAPTAVFLAALVAGCGKDAPTAGASASTPTPGGTASPGSASPGSATAAPGEAGDAGLNTYGVPIGVPNIAEKVMAAINPKHVPPYSGPTGTLKGKIRIDGDPPPDTGLKFPDHCKDSITTYGKLFRVGLDHALGDAMVAVTGYGDRGWVPATAEAVAIPLHGCVPKKLTYVATYGQRFDAFNLDKVKVSYMPYLDGASGRTIMVAIPHGDAVKLYPNSKSPAHYMLRDQLDSNLSAQIFVLNYATHDVTDLDGNYEIKRIPVGKVHVGVLLPVIDKHDEQDFDIKEGDNVLDITLHFDKTKDIPPHAVVTAPPGSSASASAAPTSAPKAPKPAPH